MFALGLPETHEDHPWGETVIKVNKKVFVFLGIEEPTEKWVPTFGVKLLSEAQRPRADRRGGRTHAATGSARPDG